MVLLLGRQVLPSWFHSISFFGHMKTLIFSTPVQSEEDLVAKITAASGDISVIPRLFHNIRQSLRWKYHKYIDVGGGNFEQFL